MKKVKICSFSALFLAIFIVLPNLASADTWCHTFNVNLGIGSSGNEVTALRTALTKEGFSNVSTELGSNDTAGFDESVASAVSGFQQKYVDEILTPLGLKYGTGFVGKATRAKLNKLYGCGTQITVCPQDMKQCPNGLSVSRTGSNCEFICPSISCAELACQIGYTSYDTGEKDSNGCPIKKCIPSTGNQPPVISGVSGPTTLKVNETGTWTVKASDPEQGILSYSVRWGDETTTGIYAPAQRAWSYTQSATFTHSYDAAGVYNPTFTVTDDKGLSAKTSISVNVGAVVTPSITVLSPNGGETIRQHESFDIKWTSTGVNTVHIYLWFADGGTCKIADVAANLGKYTDVIMTNEQCPNIPKTIVPGQYKILIYGDSEGVKDSSDNFFNLVAAATPSITVLSPNGGEQFTVKTPINIRWTSGAPGIARIDLLNSNGTYNQTIYSEKVFGYQVPNTSGSFSWTPYDTGTYYVKLYEYVAGQLDNAGKSDTSDAPFSIVAASSLSCIRETTKAGVTCGSYFYEDYCENLSDGTGYADRRKCNASTGNDCSSLVNIDRTYCPYGCQNGVCKAAIIPSITVLSPNGGEVWHPGETHRILWTPNVVNNVKIYIYDSNVYGSGSTNYITPNGNAISGLTGYYDWVIPSLNQLPSFNGNGSTNYKIRIDNSDTNAVLDSSDAAFSIVAATACQNLWWFDSTHTTCSQQQFCGGYMYQSLRTFDTQAQCNAALIQPSITCARETTKAGVTCGSYFYEDYCENFSDGTGYADRRKCNASTGNDCSSLVNIDRTYCPYGCQNGACKAAVASSITVLSPNGGEQFTVKTPINIRWTSGAPGIARIDLLNSNGTYNQTIYSEKVFGYQVPNTSGSFSWTPYDTGTYYVKLYEYVAGQLDNAGKSDTSDATFSIVAATIACTDSDNGQDYYKRGTATGLYSSNASKGIIYGEGDGNKVTYRYDSTLNYSIYYDHCFDSATSKQLNEGYCDANGLLQSIGVTCPYGCKEGACLSTLSITFSRIPATSQTSPFVAGNGTTATYQFSPWSYFQGKDWLLKSQTIDTVTGVVVNDADFLASWSDISAQNLCNSNGYCPMTGTWEASQFSCSTNVNNIRKREEWVVVNGVVSNHNVFYFKCSNATAAVLPAPSSNQTASILNSIQQTLNQIQETLNKLKNL